MSRAFYGLKMANSFRALGNLLHLKTATCEQRASLQSLPQSPETKTEEEICKSPSCRPISVLKAENRQLKTKMERTAWPWDARP